MEAGDWLLLNLYFASQEIKLLRLWVMFLKFHCVFYKIMNNLVTSGNSCKKNDRVH